MYNGSSKQQQTIQTSYSFFANRDSLCCTSSSVGVGFFVMQRVGDISLGSFSRGTDLHVTVPSKLTRAFKILANSIGM